MPEAPRAPSMPNSPETRLSHPQGADRPGPSHFGVDYDHPPVTGDSNHVAEYATAHEGRPTIAQQQKRQGIT